MTADTTTHTDNPDLMEDPVVDDGSSDGQSAPVDVPAGSRLADLMKAREERLKKEELRLPVPTWKGALAAVFRPMSIEERKEFSRQQQAKDVDEVTGGAAFIAACCTHVEMLDENGVYVPLVDDHGNRVRMGEELANKTGAKGVTTPAGCVQHLVNWNVAAVEGLFEKLYIWSQDTSAEIEGSILGE